MQTTVDLVSTDNVFHNTMEMRIKLEFSRGEHVFLQDLGLRRARMPSCGHGSAGTVGARGWGSVSLRGLFLLLLEDTSANWFPLLSHPEMG